MGFVSDFCCRRKILFSTQQNLCQSAAEPCPPVDVSTLESQEIFKAAGVSVSSLFVKNVLARFWQIELTIDIFNIRMRIGV